MIDKFLKEIREKISCPQFGDDHYGEWGILNVNQRRTIKRLIDYMDDQEAYIKNQQAEIERLNNSAKQWEDTAKDLFISRENIKAEAIEELLDKIEKQVIPNEDDVYWVELDDIYNLVKEMVGDDK